MEDYYYKGGIPSDHRNWARRYNNKVNTLIMCKKHESGANLYSSDSVESIKYSFLSFVPLFYKNVKKGNIVIIFSFLSFTSMLAAIVCIIKRVNYVLVPINQINSEVFKGKIFPDYPEINNLFKNRHRSTMKNKLLIAINPLVKKLYFSSIGKHIVSRAIAVGAFSKYEVEEITNYIDKSIAFIKYGFGYQKLDLQCRHSNFYQDNFGYLPKKLNFVYWGRLDVYYKGIDIIINACKYLKNSKNSLPFRFYLMGPDYNHSIQTIDAMISKYGLEEDIIRCGPELYISATKQPLVEADASISLSRWDGPTRSVKESLDLGVPVIISRQTHLEDIIRENKLGVVIDDINDISLVSEAMLNMCDNDFRNGIKNKLKKNKYNQSWDFVVERFIGDLNRVIDNDRQLRKT